MKRTAIVMICFFVFAQLVNGQYDPNAEFPEIGKPCPDITIRNIEYFSKRQVSLNDFKGKWVILDFWSKYCAGCIESFPEINRISQAFKDKVQLLTVCYIWREGGEREMYEKFRKKEHLDFPVAFDSLLGQRFNISGVPHCIIIDDQGIVRAITSSIHQTDIAKLLKGEDPGLSETYSGDEKRDSIRKSKGDLYYSKLAPWLTGGEGDSSIVYKALLAKYDKHAGYRDWSMYDYFHHNRNPDKPTSQVLFANASLFSLYSLAFTGSWFASFGPFSPDYFNIYPRIICETRDSLRFSYKESSDKSNTYSFSLTMAPLQDSERNMEQFKKAMQRELHSHFGYDAKMEYRDVPYLRLVVTSEKTKEKLRTKGGAASAVGDYSKAQFINQPIKYILTRYLYGHYRDVVVDETGITDGIDIDLNVPDHFPLEDWRAELRKHGLDLVEGRRKMWVLVIRDETLAMQ